MATPRSGLVLLFLVFVGSVGGFASTSNQSRIKLTVLEGTKGSNFWLQDFETATGEVINPYDVLKIKRSAELSDIKKSYRNLSRRYHPDAAMRRDILPGKCNNMDDVREEWERIKLSYEILSNKRSRMKYDRHEMVKDPGEAMKRAALDAVGKGISGVGSGLWGIGSFALKKILKEADS